ncbi:hypothetical protein AVEN_170728-1 [Araneus ventricosus]|uniref:Uncharacterized protein n=1 Tax=Araneus ventricosus TaxID=182803 RepID=A0A4Y2VQ19_ARAVE|nr:hypothetical protein AVEN_170728-1 [Araneus ventricosus]
MAEDSGVARVSCTSSSDAEVLQITTQFKWSRSMEIVVTTGSNRYCIQNRYVYSLNYCCLKCSAPGTQAISMN